MDATLSGGAAAGAGVAGGRGLEGGGDLEVDEMLVEMGARERSGVGASGGGWSGAGFATCDHLQ